MFSNNLKHQYQKQTYRKVTGQFNSAEHEPIKKILFHDLWVGGLTSCCDWKIKIHLQQIDMSKDLFYMFVFDTGGLNYLKIWQNMMISWFYFIKLFICVLHGFYIQSNDTQLKNDWVVCPLLYWSFICNIFCLQVNCIGRQVGYKRATTHLHAHMLLYIV